MMQADVYDLPMLFDATHVYSPSSSGKIRLMDSVALSSQKFVRKSLECGKILPSFSHITIGSGWAST